MGIGQRLADVLENAEVPGQIRCRRLPFLEHGGERVPLDELHGEKRPAIRQRPQLVNRRNARMLQLSGDLGFLDETPNHVGIFLEPGLSTLTARFRFKSSSCTRKTTPMPPRPIHPSLGSPATQVADRPDRGRLRSSPYRQEKDGPLKKPSGSAGTRPVSRFPLPGEYAFSCKPDNSTGDRAMSTGR